MTDIWNPRLDIAEALEGAGWTGDPGNPLGRLTSTGATWAITNDCGDSQLGTDAWTIAFDSGVPTTVVVATCLAAVNQLRAVGIAEDGWTRNDLCGQCRRPFDPTDPRFDGRARQGETGFCRSCTDRCHDSEIADHRCPICR